MRAAQIVQELGGPRLYLADGYAMHAGEGLQIELSPGVWIGGRYEYTIDNAGKLRPALYVAYVCDHGAAVDCGCELAIGIPVNASLRRPVRS